MHRINASSFKRLAGWLPWALPVLDVAGVGLSFLVAYGLVFDFPMPRLYRVPLVVSMLFVPFVFDAFGLYRTWRGDSLPREVIKVFSAWAWFIAGLLIVAALTKVTASYSRIWAVAWLLSGWIWLTGSRVVLRALLGSLRAQGLNQKRILLVGDAPKLARLVSTLREHKDAGYLVIGYIAEQRLDAPVLAELNYLGGVSGLEKLVAGRGRNIEEIWIAYSFESHSVLRDALNQLNTCTSTIRVLPDLLSLELLHAAPVEVAGMPMLDLNRSPINGLNRLLKELEDWVLAPIALLVAIPLMVLIALGIKLSSKGPVLFRQRRHGLRGEIFEIYKFRTMHLHREADGRVTQARQNDDRVFAFGKLLRRTSLDELPQLLNVMLGQMSLVGPRPHPEVHNLYYQNIIERYMWRHSVKPGMTGWAQVNGLRGETDTLDKMERRLEHDLHYIQNWSLWLDLEILILTVFRGLIHRHAY